jgi:hypothetical protein
MTQSPPPAPVRTALLPQLALVCVLFGGCVPPLWLVGVVLGIISLAKRREPAYAAGQRLAVASLVVGLVILPLLVLVVAVPRFMKFPLRSRQAECKMNLKAAFFTERAYFEEHQAYAASPAALQLKFEGPTRYLYRFDRQGPLSEAGFAPTLPSASPVEQLEQGIPPTLLARVGVTGTCPACEATVVCVGNLDQDPVLDVWSISTAERTAANGEVIPAGVPYNDVSDLD